MKQDLHDLGCDNEAELTIASLFLFQSFMWGNNNMSFVLNYVYFSVRMTKLKVLQGHSAHKASLHMA